MDIKKILIIEMWFKNLEEDLWYNKNEITFLNEKKNQMES
jgi:hypothetical protein